MMPVGLAIIAQVIAEGKKEGLDKEIDFSREKFAFGLNLVLLLLPLCWLWLTRVANPMKLKKVPGGRELIDYELREMGPMNPGERWTALVFALTAFAWIFQKQIEVIFPDPKLVTDAAIGMTGGLLLFLIPISLRRNLFVLDWHWAAKMPWGVLILFGGGLAMADGFKDTKLADWIGSQVGLLENAPILVLVIAVTTLIIFLTELTSNTATAAMVMPILTAVAIGLGQNPLLLIVPAAIAASCAFMLPVATPPNAIVFGSGYVTIPQMVRSGFGLNILGIVLVTVLTYALVIPVFDVVIGELPAWVQVAAK
jgi:sodium-dependent dicarboxylate transporter 2/3/5